MCIRDRSIGDLSLFAGYLPLKLLNSGSYVSTKMIYYSIYNLGINRIQFYNIQGILLTNNKVIDFISIDESTLSG